MVNLLGLTGTSGLKPRFHFESRLEHPMTTCWQDILRESKQLMAKQVPSVAASCCVKQCNGRSTFDWSLPAFYHVCVCMYIYKKYTYVLQFQRVSLHLGGFVHSWMNPTYALTDLAAIVQHLLLGIRCLGIPYLHELSLRIAFTCAAYNDALLEDTTLDSSIHT